MRLSEITTDRAVEILCELTPHISNIVTDEELLSELKRAVASEEVATRAQWVALGVEKINKIVPIVLKKRKSDVFGILGVLNEKTAEEIANQNLLVTMIQVREVIKDKELLDFFKSCADSEGSE